MKSTPDILLIGKGGCESAMAWKLLGSPRLGTLYTAPGSYPGAIQATGLDVMDFDAVIEFVRDRDIDMVVIIPTEYIQAGFSDALMQAGVNVIAPSMEAAQLETSKEMAKEFMAEAAIPTPRSMSVTTDTLDEGTAFMEMRTPPYVLKADGLARGCGVAILPNLADAKDCLTDMLNGLYGRASRTVIIEDYVHGRECSVIIATDGESYIVLPPVVDYKRLQNGDTGPNTGGMGGYSPVHWADEDFISKVSRRIIDPTLDLLRERGIQYKGFLYFGIKSDHGEPVLLEYNVRPGDPEAQVILPRLETDPVTLLEGIVEGKLHDIELRVSPQACAAVVVAGPKYPCLEPRPDFVHGLEEAEATGCLVFGGDIAKDAAGRLATAGGRAVTVAAMAGNVTVAAETALAGAACIVLEGAHYRTDIGAGCIDESSPGE